MEALCLHLLSHLFYNRIYFSMSQSTLDYSQPFCYVMVGPTGSGKSKVAKQLATHEVLDGATFISTDICVKRYQAEMGVGYQEAYDAMNRKTLTRYVIHEVRKAVSQRKSMIIDRCNLTYGSRRKFLRHVPSHYNVVIVLMEWDDKKIVEAAMKNLGSGKDMVPIANILFMLKCFQYPFRNEYDVLVKHPADYSWSDD